MKALCKHCDAIATWCYMPGDSFCCDTHVPRGCSCNIKYKDELTFEGDLIPLVDEHGNWIEETDSNGLLYPCCEWDYSALGFDNE